jgi:DMSO/TMAO reductase YedYZ molybdopterin-dependent catalytic subunit
MKKGMNVTIFILLIIGVLLILGMFIYFRFNKNIIQLPSAEIRDYNGTKLDSINDFVDTSIKGTQHINISDYTLSIYGLVANPKNYTYAQVLSHQNYEKIVKLNCVEGWSANTLWKGVLISDLFNEVQPLKNATVVIFHAADDYTTNFPVSYFMNKSIIMAYGINNVTIPAEEGYPFILVAENKWGYKWIMWITGIEFSNDTNYTGYWESRGYSNEGNLNESFIG